jgi:hypothetical protein
MKSDNMWDLGTEGGQQRLLIPTAGVTAAYAEQAHKLTLNASSDIFARHSKLQTKATKSRFSAPTISMLRLIRVTRLRCNKNTVFFPLLAATPGPFQLEVADEPRTRASSLARLSAGIRNPRGHGYINQPARAAAGWNHAGRNNHYGA